MGYIKKILHRVNLLLIKQRKLRDFDRFEKAIYRANYSLQHQTGSPCTLIVMIDENTPKGGLVDKLKGIVSGYLLAEKLNYRFYIYIKAENFPLYDFIRESFSIFIIPNNKDVISFNKKQSRPVVVYNHLPFIFQWSLWRLQHTSQIHLYCNLDLTHLIKKCSKQESAKIWGQTFNKLFYFDNRIVNTFPPIPSKVNKIGIHLRFMSLLGDFQDSGVAPQVPAEQQISLIEACKKKLMIILEQYGFDSVFFLFTDSVRFIDSVMADSEIANLNRSIFADRNNIAHTGLMGDVDSLERAIRDFYFLSRCDKVILIREEGMHNSDFSRYASYLNCNDFNVLDNLLIKYKNEYVA